jgi:hypothetical protein
MTASPIMIAQQEEPKTKKAQDKNYRKRRKLTAN